jgi:hypothetical protein
MSQNGQQERYNMAQMTFAEIGTLYNNNTDKLGGGVGHQNMRSIQWRDRQHSRFGGRSSGHRA